MLQIYCFNMKHCEHRSAFLITTTVFDFYTLCRKMPKRALLWLRDKNNSITNQASNLIQTTLLIVIVYHKVRYKTSYRVTLVVLFNALVSAVPAIT